MMLARQCRKAQVLRARVLTLQQLRLASSAPPSSSAAAATANAGKAAGGKTQESDFSRYAGIAVFSTIVCRRPIDGRVPQPQRAVPCVSIYACCTALCAKEYLLICTSCVLTQVATTAYLGSWQVSCSSLVLRLQLALDACVSVSAATNCYYSKGNGLQDVARSLRIAL